MNTSTTSVSASLSFAAYNATVMNNRAIQALENRCFEEAAKLFSTALGTVKQIMAASEVAEDASNASADAADVECCFTESRVHDKQRISSGPFIFRNPMVMLMTQQQQHQFQQGSVETILPFCYYSTLSFVLLYNLALTYNIVAVEGKVSEDAAKQRNCLRKALSLYELAYTVQMTEELDLSILQTMALVNNLGQVHLRLGANGKSRQCMEHLLSTIMMINDCGQQTQILDMEGFVANVMPLIGKNESAAAA